MCLILTPGFMRKLGYCIIHVAASRLTRTDSLSSETVLAASRKAQFRVSGFQRMVNFNERYVHLAAIHCKNNTPAKAKGFFDHYSMGKFQKNHIRIMRWEC